jgi:hypothetical protein
MTRDRLRSMVRASPHRIPSSFLEPNIQRPPLLQLSIFRRWWMMLSAFLLKDSP